MGFELPKEKSISGWIEHSNKKAAELNDTVMAEAYRNVAKRLTKFPYNAGLKQMSESEYRRILGWNKLKSRVFKPDGRDSDRRAA